jgi:CheY-like chemotaxis protein
MEVSRDGRGPGSRALRRSSNPRAERGPRASFLAVSDSAPLADHLRMLLESLLGPTELEVLPQEGPLALSRLRAGGHHLAFLSLQMRGMDALTLLRALPAPRAQAAVLMVPDTLEGYRAAWEGLVHGARDFLVSKGAPPLRFRGSVGHRLRQLAHLMAPAANGDELQPLRESSVTAMAGGRSGRIAAEDGAPWVVLAESWNLALVAEWLSRLCLDAPVVIRLPEGSRLQRVARENLGRLGSWPVRPLLSGDRLIRGHIHLLAGTETLRLETEGSHVAAHVRLAAGPPGSWGAYRDLLGGLRESTAPVRILLPEPGDPEEEAFLLEEGGSGRFLYHLERSAPAWTGGEDLVLALTAQGGRRRAA